VQRAVGSSIRGGLVDGARQKGAKERRCACDGD
jgi:hypothetical protein